MKKIVIYLVCITIFLQLGFQAFQIVGQLIYHKVKIEAAIKSGKYNSHLIQFSDKDLLSAKWDGTTEFELNNQKYDLVERVITAEGTVYYCINDKIEKSLICALEKAAQKTKTQQSQSSKNTLLFYLGNTKMVYLNFSFNSQPLIPVAFPMVLEGYPNLPFQPPTTVI